MKQRKRQLITYIESSYHNWKDFYNKADFTKRADGVLTYGGWYVMFDGFLPTGRYLQTGHPSGDDVGEVLSSKDVFKKSLWSRTLGL